MFKFIKSQNEKDRVTKEYIENIEKRKVMSIILVLINVLKEIDD